MTFHYEMLENLVDEIYIRWLNLNEKISKYVIKFQVYSCNTNASILISMTLDLQTFYMKKSSINITNHLLLAWSNKKKLFVLNFYFKVQLIDIRSNTHETSFESKLT